MKRADGILATIHPVRGRRIVALEFDGVIFIPIRQWGCCRIAAAASSTGSLVGGVNFIGCGYAPLL